MPLLAVCVCVCVELMSRNGDLLVNSNGSTRGLPTGADLVLTARWRQQARHSPSIPLDLVESTRVGLKLLMY